MVTKMAKNMVTRWGMSELMGPIAYQENEEEVFLGRSVARTQNVSEETAKKIDAEVRKIVDTGYNRAKKILTEKLDDLHKISKALLEYETLNGDEIRNLIYKNIFHNRGITKDEESSSSPDSALGSMGLKPKLQN